MRTTVRENPLNAEFATVEEVYEVNVKATLYERVKYPKSLKNN